MRYPAPGRVVDVGGFRLHLNCSGTGSPAVVLDAALGGSSISWSLVQPVIAKRTRICSYDRAGLGWSDAGPMPRTAGRVADELHTLLAAANGTLINSLIRAKMPYAAGDLVPVTGVTASPSLLVVDPSLKAMNMKELQALARAEPRGIPARIVVMNEPEVELRRVAKREVFQRRKVCVVRARFRHR